MTEEEIEERILDNKGLIFYTLNKFFTEHGFDDDLYQVGLIGLWHAAQKYDETKGGKFSTFAVVCIKNEIADELKRQHAIFRGFGVITNSLNERFGIDDCYEEIDQLEDTDQPVCTIDFENFIKKLPERDRKIVYMKARGHTFQTIGNKIGISSQRVHQKWDVIKERMVKECL